MSEILNKQLTLKLNASWLPIDQMTIKDAVVFLASEANGSKPGYALDITTAVDENGNHVIVNARPVAWEEWVTLPVREGDLAINTSKGQVRAPLVVICAKFNKLPMHRPRWSTGNVHARDKGVCAYTNKKLSRAEMTVDHIMPRSRGGKDTWTNTVTCDRKINTLKGDKTPEEAGLKLLRQPKEPPSVPPSVRLKADPKHPVWIPFLH